MQEGGSQQDFRIAAFFGLDYLCIGPHAVDVRQVVGAVPVVFRQEGKQGVGQRLIGEKWLFVHWADSGLDKYRVYGVSRRLARIPSTSASLAL